MLEINRTLSVMLTYRCNAECSHCGTFSNPRIKERLDQNRITSAIKQSQKLGFSNVVFTGGEATLYMSDLLEGISTASNIGLLTRVVTNAVWALKKRKAHDTISAFKAAGLTELNVSTGDEHVRFVPIQAVFNAIDAALDHDIRCHVMIESVRDTEFSEQLFRANAKYSKFFDNGKLAVTESPWMPLEPTKRGSYREGQAATEENLQRFGGCPSVLQTYVLSSDEFVSACCGLGVRKMPEMHSLEAFDDEDPDSLKEIVHEAEQDFMKLWLRTEGPEHILAWAKSKNPEIDWEGIYAHRCQACLRVYSDETVKRVIADHYHEKIADVTAKYFVSNFSGSVSGGVTEDEPLRPASG